jgi:hypothetical protein
MPSEEKAIHNHLKIHHIYSLDYRRIVAWLKDDGSSGSQFTEEKKSSPWSQWLIKLQRSFPFNVFLAEGGPIYIYKGYQYGKIVIKQEKVDVIYSSFMPYADHIIAFMLKRKFPHVKWVADFRDLHVEPIYKNTFWPEWQKKVEKRILSKADIVTTVSDGLTIKMKVLHPCVHTLLKGVQMRERLKQYEKFTVLYTGSLFLDYRDPGSFFEILYVQKERGNISSSNFQFVYAGKDSSKMRSIVSRYGLDDVYVDKGMLLHNEVKEMQSRSHVNLMLTSVSEYHSGLLTGKFFEYIEAGNAIVCVINGRDKEIETMFERYNLGSVFFPTGNDTTWQKVYLQSLIQKWKQDGKLEWESNRALIQEEMDWGVQARKLLALIKG